MLSDCVGSYFPEFQQAGLAMIAAQGGIFGWVAPSEAFLTALTLQEIPQSKPSTTETTDKRPS